MKNQSTYSEGYNHGFQDGKESLLSRSKKLIEALELCKKRMVRAEEDTKQKLFFDAEGTINAAIEEFQGNI